MSRFRSLAMRGVVATAAMTLLTVVAPPNVAAQAQVDDEVLRDVILDGAGLVPDYNVSAARRAAGFQLFASRDGAASGTFLPGNLSRKVDNYGPCEHPFEGSTCQWDVFPSRGGGATFQFFEIIWFAGAPPSEWVKIRNVAPSVANAKGGGYTALMNFLLFAGRAEWGPRDGGLSTLFAGVTSTSDGGCTDHRSVSAGTLNAGFPLLAGSNCPPTWPSSGWGGARTAPLESYIQQWQAQGQSFTFDPLAMPEDMKRPSQFAGTNFSTYGESSDHYEEILEGYGSVIPGGTGEPQFEGYPLGLVTRFESFSFGVPSLASVEFYRVTLINRSEDVYGTGVDYEKLYFGYQPGTGGTGAGGGQQYQNYYIPDQGMAIYHQSGTQGPSGPCGDGFRAPPGVPNCDNSAGSGYGNGGNAIIVLRSPIGDLRNKLFTRTTAGLPCTMGVDPFCDPTHPLADDTITFNHGHECGFGGCWATTHNVNDRRSFGMISSTAENVMDGRDPGSLAPGDAYITFRNAGFPNEIGVFNHYVPGTMGAASWDYDNDGVQDTLWLDTCHVNGCVVVDADTAPGGQVISYGNVGGVLSAGPFPLAAGDSTTWWVAHVGDTDSVSTWATIGAALDLYLTFFLAPEAPPAAEIVSTQIRAAVDGTGNVGGRVALFFTEAPEQWVDPFLSKLADDLEAAPPGTPNGDLVVANPSLVADLRARAADNLDRIEIYKSCDGGTSFTSDGDCIGDPASDQFGLASGFGWEAYAVLSVDGNQGDIPNSFVDNSVDGGRTYLYVFIAQSRGATFLLNDPATGGPIEVDFAPQISNPLSRSSSDPNVVSIYVPASNHAGFVPAEAQFNVEGGAASVPFEIDFGDNAVPGNYVVRFGNQILVQRDSNTMTETVVGTRVIVERTVSASTPAPGTLTVVDSVEYFRGDAAVLPVSGSPSASSTTTVGDILRTEDTYTGLGFAVASGSTPFFISQTLTGTAATPTSVFALPDFPGFTVSANNDPAGDYNSNDEYALRGDATKQRLRTEEDTVNRGTVDALMTQWREQNSTPTADGGGRYRIDYADEAFGLPNGIVLNFANPEATGAELRAAITARAVGTTGAVDAETATLLGVLQADLVAVKAPFTIRNVTHDRPVEIAMTRRLADNYRLGSGTDTIRVEIPGDHWVPGDELFFIETLTEDSLDAGDVVLDGAGRPLQVPRRAETFSEAVIGCNLPSAPACNPAAPGTRGESGYLPRAAGDADEFEYYVGFDATTVFDFDLVAPVSGANITSITDSALAEIRVVPNPFVVISGYQTNLANSRVLFTNMPPTGTIRIYSVSGQFIQEINWNPDDLLGAGDLFYDLKSRENIDIASGLYIWVLTAPSDPTSVGSAPITARGKFVVIRGKPR